MKADEGAALAPQSLAVHSVQTGMKDSLYEECNRQDVVLTVMLPYA